MTAAHRLPSSFHPPRRPGDRFGHGYRRGRHSGATWCSHPGRTWDEIEAIVGAFYAFESFSRTEVRPGVLAAWMNDGSDPGLRSVWRSAAPAGELDDSFLRGFCEAVTAYFDGVE